MSKFKKGDRVMVVQAEEGLWGMMTKGLVGLVVRVGVESRTGWVQVRTDGKNMLEGEGISFTSHEDCLAPATELAKAIYGA